MGASAELNQIVADFRGNPGVQQKASLALVSEVLGGSDWEQGPGDDAAAVATAHGYVLAAGEALWPPFVENDPFGAGIGAVVANVNDIAAMGGRCLGIVDTVVAPERTARQALEGLRWGAERYGVPILGGHLTVRDGPPALSAFALGQASVLLSARRVQPGHAFLYACSLEGHLRSDFPFYPSFEERGDMLPADVARVAEAGEAGACVAAKDVSMAGFLGSLVMLLEPTGCGATLDLASVPRPGDVALDTWLRVFPSYGFLLCAPADRVSQCVELFQERGLACAEVGRTDGTGQVRARLDNQEAVVMDLNEQSVTRLAAPTS